MSIIAFDPARLITTLNKTGLQIEDNTLYQFLRQLVGAVNLININGSAADSGVSPAPSSIISQGFIVPGLDGESGEDGAIIVGPQGAQGVTGAQGPVGGILLNEDGEDGFDGFNIPNPGPQGVTGSAGGLGVSLFPIDGEDGEDGFPIQGPAGAGSSAWTTAFKTSDETRYDNTIAADTDLKFTMAASKKYAARLVVLFTSTTAADFKFGNSGPAAPTRVAIRRSHIPSNSVTMTNSVDNAYVTSVTTASTTGKFGWVVMECCISNGVNAGDFAFTWAQNTTVGGDDTTVLAGSYIEYKQLD